MYSFNFSITILTNLYYPRKRKLFPIIQKEGSQGVGATNKGVQAAMHVAWAAEHNAAAAMTPGPKVTVPNTMPNEA